MFKGDRQTANLGNGYNYTLYDSPPNFGRDGYIFTQNGSEFANHGSVDGEVNNTWQRIDQWIVISTPDVANGRYDYYIDNVLRRSSGNYATCSSAASNGCQIDSWISPNYVNKTTTITFWIDDLYVDNTQARVELCSGSSWANRGNCNIQIPSAWHETSITATVNTGAFSESDTAYLYVVDANGDANADGYAVTIGESSTPTPINGACGTNHGATLSSLTSGNANNCSAGNVSGFTGTGPWSWTCTGLNGGDNSAICSASLSSGSSGTGMRISAESSMRVSPGSTPITIQ